MNFGLSERDGFILDQCALAGDATMLSKKKVCVAILPCCTKYYLISGDDEIRSLKERLEETERAMQMIVTNMAAMTSHMPKSSTESVKDSKELSLDKNHRKSPKKAKAKATSANKKTDDNADKSKEENLENEEEETEESESDEIDNSEHDEDVVENDESIVDNKVEILNASLPLAQES